MLFSCFLKVCDEISNLKDFFVQRFNYCSWTHDSQVCDFKWNEKNFIPKDQSCVSNGTKLSFVGSFQSHECEIELENVSQLDNGKWTCLMKSHFKPIKSDEDYLNVDIIQKGKS